MKSKFFRATPGLGTGDIDSVINEWIKDRNIKVVDLKYSTHREKLTTRGGVKVEDTVYTAMLLYEDQITIK